MLRFETVHDALSWFFERSWLRSGYYCRSNFPHGERVQCSAWQLGVGDVWETGTTIALAINVELTARSRMVLESHYARKRGTQAEMALKYGVTDRQLRNVLKAAVDRLGWKLERIGVVRPPAFEKMKPAESV